MPLRYVLALILALCFAIQAAPAEEKEDEDEKLAQEQSAAAAAAGAAATISALSTVVGGDDPNNIQQLQQVGSSPRDAATMDIAQDGDSHGELQQKNVDGDGGPGDACGGFHIPIDEF